MARRSRMSILKRQRELQKSEKAARKRARRHGQSLPEQSAEPRPTSAASILFGVGAPGDEGDDDGQEPDQEATD